MWIVTSSAWCLSLHPGGWNGTSWKRTCKQQRGTAESTAVATISRTWILGHEIHCYFPVSCIFTGTIGEGMLCEEVLSQRCSWWWYSRNKFEVQTELFASRCVCLLPAQAEPSSSRMCSWASWGLKALLKHKVKRTTKIWYLFFFSTLWRSLSDNSNVSNTERRLAGGSLWLFFFRLWFLRPQFVVPEVEILKNFKLQRDVSLFFGRITDSVYKI